MKHFLVSGLLNIETSVRVRKFPIDYYPIDFPFFGVQSCVSGVAYNITKALKTLGNEIALASFIGKDFEGEHILSELQKQNISAGSIQKTLSQTPVSAVLYDAEGKRQIYSDLKDIQEKTYTFPADLLQQQDLVIACNINFNRNLLREARKLGKTIATDVHVLQDINDGYNQEFMEYADILFLSDEQLPSPPKEFIRELAARYGSKIIVLGQGSRGALLYVKQENKIYDLEAAHSCKVLNTVGAGDALFSAFLHFLTKGSSPLESLLYAELFASYKIGFNGASNGFLTEQELNKIYTAGKDAIPYTSEPANI